MANQPAGVFDGVISEFDGGAAPAEDPHRDITGGLISSLPDGFSGSRVINTSSPRNGGVFSLGQGIIVYVMRGRNTGAGPAFVYWRSNNVPDPAGIQYDAGGGVPFSNLADIVIITLFHVG